MKTQRLLSNWGKLLTWKVKTIAVDVVLHCSDLPSKTEAFFPPAAGDNWLRPHSWVTKIVTLPKVISSSWRSLHPVWLRGGVWARGIKVWFTCLTGSTNWEQFRRALPALELPVGLASTTALQFRFSFGPMLAPSLCPSRYCFGRNAQITTCP